MTREAESSLPISVVIMCFNRRKFLVQSVNSVLQQTLSRDKYEILVTKNFEDNDIDLFLSQNGIFSILEEDVNIGTMIVNAISRARGEYISFLDDDDIFYPDKLSTIFKAITSIPGLVYYHNAFDTIDSDSLKIDDYRHRHPRSQIILREGNTHTTLRTVKPLSGDINMSSITVRRDLLTKYAQHIKNIDGLQDVFIFYLSVLSGGELLLDSLVTTGYRIHTSESHGDLEDFENYSSGIRNVLKKYLKSYEILMTIRDNTLTDLRYEYLTNKCRYELMLPHREGILTIKELFYLLLHLGNAEGLGNQFFLIVLSFMHAVMPGRISDFYIHRKMRLDSSKYSRQTGVST